jgi:inosine-uridine nucleoside N-ribohydrolase
MSKPLPIIIDTDPGQDDAVAILLALASPELEVLGITAVAGNVPLALTEKNARKICELAGRSAIWSPPRRCMARPASTGPCSPNRPWPSRIGMRWTIWSRL